MTPAGWSAILWGICWFYLLPTFASNGHYVSVVLTLALPGFATAFERSRLDGTSQTSMAGFLYSGTIIFLFVNSLLNQHILAAVLSFVLAGAATAFARTWYAGGV